MRFRRVMCAVASAMVVMASIVAVSPAAAATGAWITSRVSVSSTGRQGNGEVYPYFNPAISADGRFVAFASAASNLVPGDTNEQTDVFVRDRLAGVTQRVSVGAAGQVNGGGT